MRSCKTPRSTWFRATMAIGTCIASALVAVSLTSAKTAAAAAPSSSGDFVPLSVARILDTRTGRGAPVGAVSSGGIVKLSVLGVAGVPADNVSAVVMNVTVTQPQTAGYVSVYPDGAAVPTVSNLNFVAGEDVPNLVVVPVGLGGKVDLLNGSNGGRLS